MAKARKTTPIQVSRVIAPCFLARAGRPLPSRPLLRDAVLLEEVLLIGRELLDELRILLVRHELRHQALGAVPFLELRVLQHRLNALLPLGVDLVRQVLGSGEDRKSTSLNSSH